jgi:aminopeptidase N
MRIFSRWTALAVLLLAASLRAQGPPSAPLSPAVDVIRYDVSLTVSNLGREEIAAVVRIELVARETLDVVQLNIEPARITIEGVRDGAGNVLLHTIAPGQPNAHGLTGSALVVSLAEPLSAPEPTVIEIRYRCAVQPASERRGFFFHPDHYGGRFVTTRSWPYYARYWLPSNDHPSDAAAFRFVLDVPAGVTALANGFLSSSSTAEGREIHVWEQPQPIPTYLAQVTVGEFSSVSVPLQFFYPAALPDRARWESEIARAADALEYFSAAFGPYPFSKAAFMAAPHPFDMETASLVNLVFPNSAVHEMIHHWWGNAVQIETWGDFWISEGLTTYFTGFFDEVRTGVNTSCMTGSRKLSVAPGQDPMDLFNPDPYCVGAAAIHDYRTWLAGELGRNPRDAEAMRIFLAVFRRVYEKLAFQPVTTRELTASLAEATHAELEAAGHDVSRASVGRTLRSWEQSWFTGLPPDIRRRAAGRH